MAEIENNNFKLRWDPYVLLRGAETFPFWEKHMSIKGKKMLFIMGKGFDIRMNLGLKSILEFSNDLIIDVLLINYIEGKSSPSIKYKKLAERNYHELKKLKRIKITEKNIKTWEGVGRNKRRVGDRQAAELIKDDIFQFTDIVVDISALPRGVYFSLIGKALSLIDDNDEIKKPNLFVITAENAEMDSLIEEKGIDEDLHPPFGFGGGIELESKELDILWLPILGENKRTHFEKASQSIKLSEICPLLPFPSINPRRSDDIFRDHFDLFFDVLRIEPQNIMYVPEQNPFEVYKKIVNTIINYKNTLSDLGGCKTVISTFSSKLLSIGALLAAFDLKGNEVGILNVGAQGYEIIDIINFEKVNKKSELFVTWLTGEPYL